jgi:hypothetical protein
MEKKGLAPSAIEEKMKNIPKDEIQGILEDLKNSLSPEERKAFEKRGSFIPKKQIVQNVPPQELRNKWFFGVLLCVSPLTDVFYGSRDSFFVSSGGYSAFYNI